MTDLQVAIHVLDKHFDIAIIDESLHHHFLDDPTSDIAVHVAGEKNFYQVQYLKKGKKHIPTFHPADFVAMLDAFQQNKTIIISAHNPTFSNKLPDESGIGAVFLSHLSGNASIVPIAIDIQTTRKWVPSFMSLSGIFLSALVNPGKRANAVVHIASPIDLPKRDVLPIIQILGKKKDDRTEDEVSQYKAIIGTLHKEGDAIMKKLSEMLPPEKRGKWHDV